MKRCSTCKFWGKQMPREFLRTCEHKNMSMTPQAELIPKNATVTSCCMIKTGPNFGCVLWEERKNEMDK